MREEWDKSQVDMCQTDKYTRVSVQKPMTHNTWENGKYTSYEIQLQTNDGAFSLSQSCVRRRYADFKWLRSQLARHSHEKDLPPLPKRSFFSSRFAVSVIESRMEGLEQFLQGVLKEVIYLSDSALHLFLQTELDPADMEKCMNGKSDQGVLDTILEAGKKPKNARSEDEHDGSSGGAQSMPGTNRLIPAPLSLPTDVPSSGGKIDPHSIFSPTRPPCTPPGHLFGKTVDTTDGDAMSPEVWVNVQGSSDSNKASPLSEGAGQKVKASALKTSSHFPLTSSLDRININGEDFGLSVSESDSVCSAEHDSDFCSDSSSLSGEVITRPTSKQTRKRRTVRFSQEVMVAQVLESHDSGYNELNETTTMVREDDNEGNSSKDQNQDS